jgi:hypothetical protein
MKEYIIKISIEEQKNASGIIAELKAEVNQEKKESDIAYRINEESNNVHRQILSDKIEELNQELSELGVSFGDIKNSSKKCNNYREFFSKISFTHYDYYITYTPSKSTKTDVTRYLVLSDHAEFRISKNIDSYPSSWRMLHTDSILEGMRDAIKSEIELKY